MKLASTPSSELVFHTLDWVLPWTLPPQGAHHSSLMDMVLALPGARGIPGAPLLPVQGRHSHCGGCLGGYMGTLRQRHPHGSPERF